MGYRERHRVDWDEEIRKTERIRRKGLFISALGFGVAAIFIFGANRMGSLGAGLLRKLIFALCFVISMLLLRIVMRRRERLKLKRQEEEQDRILELMLASRKAEELSKTEK